MIDPIYNTPDLSWLREGYLSEMPVVQWLAGEAELHIEIGGNSGNGTYRRWVDRLASDSFMGDFRKVLFPFHEAVKRLGPTPERRWLRYALMWRGLPCLCAHQTIAAHLAAIDRVSEETVVGGIRYAIRRAMVRLEQSGDLDMYASGATIDSGRRGPHANKRTLATTDTVAAVRSAGQDLRVTSGGARFLATHEKNPHSVPDAPLCACHVHLHGRPPRG